MNKKVIVITGSSSGIGFGLANLLTQKNYTVYGLSRNEPENAHFITIKTDITQKTEVKNAISNIFQNEKKIDCLINNAGKGMVASVEDAESDEILDLFNLNVIGSVLTISEILPYFRKQNFGKIINISSIGSEMGLPFRGYYSASKSAIDKITEALRFEVEPFGVQCTALHLGDIQTDIAKNRIYSKVSNPYKKVYQGILKNIDSHVKEGVSVYEVSVFVEKLLVRKKLKPHYYFGKFSQKMAIYLKRFLPSKLFEKILANYSKT